MVRPAFTGGTCTSTSWDVHVHQFASLLEPFQGRSASSAALGASPCVLF